MLALLLSMRKVPGSQQVRASRVVDLINVATLSSSTLGALLCVHLQEGWSMEKMAQILRSASWKTLCFFIVLLFRVHLERMIKSKVNPRKTPMVRGSPYVQGLGEHPSQ